MKFIDDDWKYRELSLEAEIQKLRAVLLATADELEDADPNRRAAIEFARAIVITCGRE